jgi:hypothetical protein
MPEYNNDLWNYDLAKSQGPELPGFLGKVAKINPQIQRQLASRTGFDAGFREQAPEALTGAYESIAKHGTLGEGGVNEIMSKIRQSRGFQRRQIARGLRKRFGRRLGPRSGATEALASNIAYAKVGEDPAIEANLMASNLRSRTEGIKGVMSVLQFIQERYDKEEARRIMKEMDEAGALDILKAGSDIAASVIPLL